MPEIESEFEDPVEIPVMLDMPKSRI